MGMDFKSRVEYLISAIRAQSPSLDTSAVSPIRVLINAVAEMGAQADTAQDRAYNWDVSSKSGRDLDNFVELFGFSRLPAKHAQGYVTLTFGPTTTRDYLLPMGTRFYSGKKGVVGRYSYVSTELVAIPKFSSYINIPIRAEFPGEAYNARPGEVGVLDYAVEQLVNVNNDRPITGGKGAETDEELRNRFRTMLFRNNLGNEAWYRNIALSHPGVAAVQIIKPSQDTEEHLKIVKDVAKCTEDSLIYSYPETFGVYLPRRKEWLEEGVDFVVTVDNQTPLSPVITFTGIKHQEGESCIVRYRYCSNKSRNNPLTNNMHYLDMFVSGTQSSTWIDLSTWPSDQVFGSGSVNENTHPDGTVGDPYFIFTKQPVMFVPDNVSVQGKDYYKNKDYVLVKDRTVNGDSTRARDILLWKTNLPAGEPMPSFRFPYFHNGVVSSLQSTIDEPDMHTAVDDVLVHSAIEIPFDFDLIIEWERGFDNVEALRAAISSHFSRVPMGSKIKMGGLMKTIQDVNGVAAAFIGENGIHSDTIIRGRNKWKFDVPLPDGSIPILNKLNITTTASNIYE